MNYMPVVHPNDYELLLDDSLGLVRKTFDENSKRLVPIFRNSLAMLSNVSANEKQLSVLYLRKKRRKDLLFPSVPRIFKRDIRRFYASMFANVWNSCDFKMIHGFMDTYFERDSLANCENTNDSVIIPSKENEILARFLFLNILTMPDTILMVDDTKVYLNSDKTLGNKVVTRFSLSGTKIYEPSDEFSNLHLLPDRTPTQNHRINEVSSDYCDDDSPTNGYSRKRSRVGSEQLSKMDAFIATSVELSRSLPLVVNPESFVMKGELVMRLNKDGQVT
jgi:hypothetical protein